MTSRDKDRLRALIMNARVSSAATGGVAYACTSFLVPAQGDLSTFLVAFAQDRDRYPELIFWYEPNGIGMRLGIGATFSEEFTGPDAMRLLQERWHCVHSSTVCDQADGPRCFAGFAFAQGATHVEPWQGWPDGWLLMPEITIEVKEEGLWEIGVQVSVDDDYVNDNDVDARVLRVAQRVADVLGAFSQESSLQQSALRHQSERTDRMQHICTPTVDRWKRMVTTAATDIAHGTLDKIVLARCVTYMGEQPFDVTTAVQRLMATYPDSTVFAVVRDATVFMGASPEHLVSVQDNRATVDCLAGTAQRGDTTAVDDQLGRNLLTSTKDLQEHALVVQGICADIADILQNIEVASAPTLRLLKNVQHLFTPVTGLLRQGVTVLDLIRCLHPTPAVSGLPKATALQAIAQREQMERGWYSGPMGWLDGAVNGTFVVALRSGLVQGAVAHLYAGVGVVADSDAEQELLETNWKLEPMRRALQIRSEGEDA